MVELLGAQQLRKKFGKAAGDAGFKKFIKMLRSQFRASDIIARAGEDSLIIFMKDVAEDKDIRKQTDEFQLFLYDFKEDASHAGLVANAGVAVYPDNADNSGDLLARANEALERSEANGAGRLSF